MWLISLNLAFKIANLAIFFIVATIETIVVTIIVSKILLFSRQCHDKPKSNDVRPVRKKTKSRIKMGMKVKKIEN